MIDMDSLIRHVRNNSWWDDAGIARTYVAKAGMSDHADAINRIMTNGDMTACFRLHQKLLPRCYWRIEEWDGAFTATIPGFIDQHETSEIAPWIAWLALILVKHKENIERVQ